MSLPSLTNGSGVRAIESHRNGARESFRGGYVILRGSKVSEFFACQTYFVGFEPIFEGFRENAKNAFLAKKWEKLEVRVH